MNNLLRLSFAVFFTCMVLTLIGRVGLTYIGDEKLILHKYKKQTMFIINFCQWLRASRLKADFAIFGDSIALNGIICDRISKKTGFKIVSLCTMIPTGPRGYAEQIEHFLESSPKSKIIIAMNPKQFVREPGWLGLSMPRASAINARKAVNYQKEKTSTIDKVALFYKICMDSLFDVPIVLPRIGESLGGYLHFQHLLLRDGNYFYSDIIRNYHSEPEDYVLHPAPRNTILNRIPKMNSLFIQDAEYLYKVVRKYNRNRFYFILLPLSGPDSEKISKAVKLTKERLSWMLGIPLRNFIKLPYIIKPHFFSDGHHFHKPGALWFSDLVADKIEEISNTK